MPALEQELTGLRILAVDDEESNLLLLRRVLEKAGYTHVVATTDPTQVPAMFAENRPDLVLLDLHMPRDGRVRADGEAGAADQRVAPACPSSC